MSWEWKMDVSGHFTDGTEIPNLLSVLPCSPENHISGYTCKRNKTIGIPPLFLDYWKKNVVLLKVHTNIEGISCCNFTPPPALGPVAGGNSSYWPHCLLYRDRLLGPHPDVCLEFSSKVLPRRCLQFSKMEPWQELPEDTHQSKLKEK